MPVVDHPGQPTQTLKLPSTCEHSGEDPNA